MPITLLKKEFPILVGKSLYAVTAFHAYAHTVNCQVKYNPRYMDGFGNTGIIMILYDNTLHSLMQSKCNPIF